MPAQPSKFAENQFLSATEERFPLMTELLADTLPRLSAAALEHAALVDANDAVGDAAATWEAADTARLNAEALGLSTTVAFEAKITGVARKPDPETNSPLETWDITIRGQAPVGGSLYTLLLPQGRETVTAGSYETQINAIQNLGIRLAAQAGKPVLVTLGAAVTAFFTATQALRTAQLGAAQEIEMRRVEQETARRAAAAELYAMVADGMKLWKLTPERVDELFSVALLRDPNLEVPAAVVDTTWAPGQRLLSTSELPAGATTLEAWRLGPGGAPERVAVGTREALSVVIPSAITFDAGKTYQLWLVARNSRGSSPPGPMQTWLAP